MYMGFSFYTKINTFVFCGDQLIFCIYIYIYIYIYREREREEYSYQFAKLFQRHYISLKNVN